MRVLSASVRAHDGAIAVVIDLLPKEPCIKTASADARCRRAKGPNRPAQPGFRGIAEKQPRSERVEVVLRCLVVERAAPGVAVPAPFRES